MSVSDQIITACTAAVPVLASIGGVIRYLVRILASVERATDVGRDAAEQLAKHIEQTDAAHSNMSGRLDEHHGRLSALEAKASPA